jgi:hypothetical protein
MANKLDIMDLKQIINLHIDGTSNRQISRTLGPMPWFVSSRNNPEKFDRTQKKAIGSSCYPEYKRSECYRRETILYALALVFTKQPRKVR